MFLSGSQPGFYKILEKIEEPNVTKQEWYEIRKQERYEIRSETAV